MEFMGRSYHVIFRGKLVGGTNKNKASIILSKILKMPQSQANEFLSGKTFVIKKNITHEQVLIISKKHLSYGIIVEFIKSKEQVHNI